MVFGQRDIPGSLHSVVYWIWERFDWKRIQTTKPNIKIFLIEVFCLLFFPGVSNNEYFICLFSNQSEESKNKYMQYVIEYAICPYKVPKIKLSVKTVH